MQFQHFYLIIIISMEMFVFEMFLCVHWMERGLADAGDEKMYATCEFVAFYIY